MVNLLQKFRDVIEDPRHKRLYEVGAMASIAAHIEHVIELILTGLIETDQRYGGAVIRWVSLQQQKDLIRKILKDRYGEDSDVYKEINESINLISESLNDRNDIIHSTYRHSNDDKTFVQNFRRGQFESPISELNLDDVEAKVNLAYERFKSLTDLVIKYDLPFPAPSLGKLPGQNEGENHIEGQNQDTQNPPP